RPISLTREASHTGSSLTDGRLRPDTDRVIRTGDEYRESIRDGREVWINGERVPDVVTHPMFKPLVDVRARIYDLAHEAATQDAMTVTDPDSGEQNAVALV